MGDGSNFNRSVVSESVERVASRDLRIAALLGETAWGRLSPTVRDRFSKSFSAPAAVTYVGEVLECRRSLAGAVAAQLARLIGAPLPLFDDVGAPAVVAVTEDCAESGQFWTRMYGRRRGFPQVIQSSKRFAGPTGLEEYLGWGFGIALVLGVEGDVLRFSSDHYFFAIGGVRIRLPAWLSPGDLVISHVDRGDGAFAFILDLRHPLFGELMRQACLFRERRPGQ
jgi:hypothetical protein